MRRNKKYRANINVQSEKKGPRVVTSNFGVTINPNIYTKPGTEKHIEVRDALLKAARKIFGTESDFKKYIAFKDRNRQATWSQQYIVGVPINNITVEYGESGYWHIQGFISVVHRSFIHLNRDRLLETVAQKLSNVKPGIGPSNIHIDIQTGSKGNNRGGGDFDLIRRANYPLKNI